MWLAQNGMADPDNAGRRGLCLHGPDGPRQPRLDVAEDGAAASERWREDEGADFHEAKLVTARFYAERELPLSTALRRKIEAGAETLMKIPAEAF